jgi:hypothetical protein
MSNSKNAIHEIKKLMVQFGFLAAEPTLLDFKLEDDTILQAEKLEVGSDIFKINELFQKVVLEDGSYVIPEAFQIEVADGKIANVKEIFVDAKLKDGTQVSISGKGVEVGAKVFVVKDGVPTPAPDATHVLEDGTCVTTKDGEIVSVDTESVGMSTMESPMESGMEPVSPVEDKTAKEQGKMNPQHMDEMYTMMKEFVTKCGSMIQKMEGQYNALENEFNAFKKEPAGKPIAYSKTDFNKEVEDALDARLKALKSLQNK